MLISLKEEVEDIWDKLKVSMSVYTIQYAMKVRICLIYFLIQIVTSFMSNKTQSSNLAGASIPRDMRLWNTIPRHSLSIYWNATIFLKK